MMEVLFKVIDFVYPYVGKRVKKFGIEEGMTVVDYGCGPGRYAVRFAKLVGENGKVYAVDIHELAIDGVRKRLKKGNISNIEPVLIEGYNSTLPDNIADRGKIGTTEENLKTALQNEEKANEEYYPEMVKDARESSKAVKKAFAQSMETDGQHADLFERAMGDMLANNETDYYVCHICGHISLGFVPENCPVCHAVSGRFKRVV